MEWFEYPRLVRLQVGCINGQRSGGHDINITVEGVPQTGGNARYYTMAAL